MKGDKVVEGEADVKENDENEAEDDDSSEKEVRPTGSTIPFLVVTSEPDVVQIVHYTRCNECKVRRPLTSNFRHGLRHEFRMNRKRSSQARVGSVSSVPTITSAASAIKKLNTITAC